MPRLSAESRSSLPDSAFAYVDARGKRRLPINDEAHVRNALARFNQVKFEDEEARERARKRLLRAAKKYGIVPIGFMSSQIESVQDESRRVMKDLSEAERIQNGLLPTTALTVANFEVSGVSLPCRAVGGDWYDFLPLPGNRLGIVLADVAGKGMGAALLMSSARSVVRTTAQAGGSPGAVLAAVNRVLIDELPSAKFITMIYAVLDPAARSLTFASAGHMPPILADASDARTIKPPSQLPLGIREGAYEEHTIELPVGSRLFLYSDGVIEARGARSVEYGEARLLQYARGAVATAQGLLDDVRTFMKHRPAIDDITVVAVQAHGGETGAATA